MNQFHQGFRKGLSEWIRYRSGEGFMGCRRRGFASRVGLFPLRGLSFRPVTLRFRRSYSLQGFRLRPFRNNGRRRREATAFRGHKR